MAVYFVEGAGLIKIGHAADPWERFDIIQRFCPIALTMLGWMDGQRIDERRLHVRFEALRHHSEWFRAADELRLFIAGNASIRTPQPAIFAAHRCLNGAWRSGSGSPLTGGGCHSCPRA